MTVRTPSELFLAWKEENKAKIASILKMIENTLLRVQTPPIECNSIIIDAPIALNGHMKQAVIEKYLAADWEEVEFLPQGPGPDRIRFTFPDKFEVVEKS